MNTLVLANIMGPQGLLIFLVLLLMFGARRLPELAKGLGQAIREFSKAKNDIHDEIMREPTPPPQPPRQIEVQTVQATPVPPVQAAQPQPAPNTQPVTAPQTTTTPV
jgi:sec-independent protein translocase protein TatA